MPDEVSGQTVRYWSRHYGKKEASVMKAINRKFGTGYTRDSILTPEQVSAIFSDDKPVKTASRQPRLQQPPSAPREIHKTHTPQPEPQEVFSIEALRGIVFDVVCIGIVVGHASLIWYDCATQWGAPGTIGGGLAFLIVMAALLISTDASRVRTSASALWFVFFVDAAAWFVHYPTFQMYADIGDTETGAFAAFLCLSSWVALYIYRDSKID